MKGMKIKTVKKENARAEIEVVLSLKEIETHREHIESDFLKNIDLPGFRKGHVPKDIAEKHLNKAAIFEEMVQHAISHSFQDIIKESGVEAIGYPEILITKIAEGTDAEVKITTALAPEIKLGDYKKIAKEENNKEYTFEVEDREVDEAIYNLRKMSAQQKIQDQGSEPVSWSDIKDEDLPPLDEEWVKTLGQFKDLSDLKAKIKENIEKEKEAKNIEKRRMEIMQRLVKDSEFEIPQLFLDHELDKMMHEFEHNITMTGMAFDEYLESIKKTRDDYRKEWKEQAEERVKTELALGEIAKKEKITPEQEVVDKEVEYLMNQYKNQPGIQEANVRHYVTEILTHQKVFEFLDNCK